MSLTAPNLPFKKNIQGLIKLASRSEQSTFLLNAMERHLHAFPEYVNAIWNCEHMTSMAYVRHFDDREMLHDRIEAYDRQRKGAHDNMVIACKVLNNICTRLDTPRFCPDLELDAAGNERVYRKLCADFCGDVVLEVYESRDGNQLSQERLEKIAERGDLMQTAKFDEAVSKIEEHGTYDPGIIRKLPQELYEQETDLYGDFGD